VLGAAQRPFIGAFLDFSVKNWPRLDAAMASGNVGTDQTPLNFMVKREKEPVFFLPRPFNFVNCFAMPEELSRLGQGARPDPALFAEKAAAHPWAFDFIELSYIWHFTNVVTMRSLVMGETWRRVQSNYPGAVVRDAQGDSPRESRPTNSSSEMHKFLTIQGRFHEGSHDSLCEKVDNPA